MKKLAKITVIYIVLCVSTAFGSTPNPEDQFDLIQGGIPAKVEVTRQEIKAMDTSIDQLLRRTGGLLSKDKKLEEDLGKLKEELEKLKGELGKVVRPGDLTIIRVGMGKLWAQVNNHEQRLTELEGVVKGHGVTLGDHEDRLRKVEDRLDKGLGVKFGLAAYGVHGTQGSVSGGASARLRIPLSGGWQAIVNGGVGGHHQGASGFADLSIGYLFTNGIYLGATLGTDANCDGMCTRLLTEIWGAGPDIGYLSDGGFFLRGRVLLGSEWTKGPTTQIEYSDRTVYKTHDSRDFGLSALLQLGQEF